jgi:uncharacterized protein (TIGR00369 family)
MTWSDALGLEMLEVTPARVEARLVVTERLHQPFGLVHGGVWASVVEEVGSIGGSAAAQVRDPESIVVGVANSTDFFRPVAEGEVRVIGVPIHVGRLQQVWQVDITTVPDAKLVARGQLRVQQVPRPPG